MILMIDNYDSFTYNLVHMLYAMDLEVEVHRNDEISCEDIKNMSKVEAIILSPGPSEPSKAGEMENIIREFKGKIPIFGVCLGHQAIGEVFGGKIIRAKKIMHGKTSNIEHDGRGVFEKIRNNFRAVRYHSLVIDEATLPDCLEVSARSEDGEIMGIRHKELPIEGVQYHPESIMTSNGKQLLTNFIKMADKFNREELRGC